MLMRVLDGCTPLVREAEGTDGAYRVVKLWLDVRALQLVRRYMTKDLPAGIEKPLFRIAMLVMKLRMKHPKPVGGCASLRALGNGVQAYPQDSSGVYAAARPLGCRPIWAMQIVTAVA